MGVQHLTFNKSVLQGGRRVLSPFWNQKGYSGIKPSLLLRL
jgi:hypothetical protein